MYQTVGLIRDGKYRQNLHLKDSCARVPIVQKPWDWLSVLIQVHYLLLTLLYAHMFLMKFPSHIFAYFFSKFLSCSLKLCLPFGRLKYLAYSSRSKILNNF